MLHYILPTIPRAILHIKILTAQVVRIETGENHFCFFVVVISSWALLVFSCRHMLIKSVWKSSTRVPMDAIHQR